MTRDRVRSFHRRRTLLTAFLAAVVIAATVLPAQADFRLEKTLALAPGGEFQLNVDAGRITVRGVDRPDVRIVVTSERDDIERWFDFRFEELEDRVEVRIKRRKASWFGRSLGDLHFDVEIPRRTDVDLHSSGGRIEARDVDGIAKVDTSGGRIELRSVTGGVLATTSGGSISVRDLGADARLDTSGGRISVERVAGDVRAETSGGSIEIRGAGGRIDARTSGGSVTAYFDAGNGAGGSLSSSGGRVTAYVDPTAALDIEASSSGGGVTVDLPITVQGKISRHSIRGTVNGGGPLLRLHTSGGGVAVREL